MSSIAIRERIKGEDDLIRESDFLKGAQVGLRHDRPFFLIKGTRNGEKESEDSVIRKY